MKALVISLIFLLANMGVNVARDLTPAELKLQAALNAKSGEIITYDDVGYCNSEASDTNDDWITRVEFAGIDNPSGSTVYSDFTSVRGAVLEDQSYPISVHVINNTGGTWPYGVRVWIDWNQDLVFDAAELYDLGINDIDGGETFEFTGTIDVPADAIQGVTRMRVLLYWNPEWEHHNDNAWDTACREFSFGEVEDYSVWVGPPPVSISLYAFLIAGLLILGFLVLRFRFLKR